MRRMETLYKVYLKYRYGEKHQVFGQFMIKEDVYQERRRFGLVVEQTPGVSGQNDDT